ncbi:MAG: hypothetical protein U5Q03_01880 [Bacteroidota bacterium]|nr:hypothetical protein [Bacteroidota bacterium]
MGKNKVLIHGGRTLESFHFQEELKKMMGDRYIRCCSQEKETGFMKAASPNTSKNKIAYPRS